MSTFLFWYILRDLLKNLLLSTSVLVTIISFGAAINPLGDGDLGPLQLVTYITLAMPPMLQFALPFAAAFSATIVYHRMATDNEISACASGGVSYGQMLMPAAMLGVVLTIGLSVLANYVSPGFFAAMDRVTRMDAPDFIRRSVLRGEPIKIDRYLIYAADVADVPPPAGGEVYASLWLDRLVIAAMDPQGRVASDMTASQALFHLSRRRNETIVRFTLQDVDTAQLRADAPGMMLATEGAAYTESLVIPDSFKNSPKFMDLEQMRAVTASPQEYYKVAELYDQMRTHLAAVRLHSALRRRLGEMGRLDFERLVPSRSGEQIRRRYVVEAGRLGAAADGLHPLEGGDGPVRVTLMEQGRAVTQYESALAHVRTGIDPVDASPLVDLTLSEVTFTDLTRPDARPTQRPALHFPGLRYHAPAVAEIGGMEPAELAALAVEEAQRNPDSESARLLAALQMEVRELQDEILSRIHERTALSVSCVVMMLLGSLLAVGMRSALPLTVYFCSFIPAVVGLVLIGAGSDIAADASRGAGLAIMWSGNAVMTVAGLVLYRYVARN